MTTGVPASTSLVMRGSCIVILLISLAPIAHAGSGSRAQPTATKPPPPKPASPAPKIDVPLAPGFELRAPIREGHLWIYPIATTDAPLEMPYTTLQDGLDHYVVSVRETPKDHSTVTVTNASKAPLLIIRGELLVGGYQDQITATDWTIQPGETAQIGVYCAERERFEGTTDKFTAGHAVAELSVRYALDNNPHRAQHEIWEAIKDANAREGTSNPTEAYRFTPARVAARTAAARTRVIGQLSRPDVVGFAVAIDGHGLMGVHQFPTVDVRKKLAPMVLSGYLPSW